ncbi:MAG: glycosyltransferase, partial [Elusimicrobiales bacterium]|nr:glycosyltransferase [Elusimicrobiales bacterium]
MKIAIDALPLLGHAGGKVFLQQLINALFDYDKDNEYNLVFRKYNLDLKKYRLKFTNQNNIKIDKILMPNRIMEYFWTFNEFNFLKGDTLYNNSDIFLSLLYFFPIFKKTKTVSILYDITTLKIDEYGSHKKEFMIRMNNLIKRSDKIVAISEFTKKDFCQYFNYPERNVDVVYPTVDLSFKVLDRNKVENMIKK